MSIRRTAAQAPTGQRSRRERSERSGTAATRVSANCWSVAYRSEMRRSRRSSRVSDDINNPRLSEDSEASIPQAAVPKRHARGGQSSATNCGHFRSKPVRKSVFLVTNIWSAGAAVDVLDPPFRFAGPRWIDPSDSRQLVPEYAGKQCDWKPQPHSPVRPMRRHVNLRHEPRMTSAKLTLRAELIFARAPVSS